MATLETIQARIRKLEAQAQVLKTKAASGVLKQIHDLMARHEISIEDVTGFFGKTSGKTKAKAGGKADSAKYVDPKTGATWSGRGRAPAWIANARDRSVFLAADAGEPAARAKVSVKRKTAARKGPQPALYRDPISGLTWSGFGRAPGWIANAKDRNAFLIEKGNAAGEGATESKVVAKKGATANAGSKAVATTKKAKPAAKKAASTKTAPTKKAAAAKKEATAKKVVAAEKVATAKKGSAAKKATAVKKAPAARKTLATKNAAAAKKGTVAKKAAKTVATKRVRSASAGPARKAPVATESIVPVETTGPTAGTEAENASQ
jgi:DNA-binding protein H-NS